MQPVFSDYLATRCAASADSRWLAALRLYFRSGWAFFMPYLLLYLLYHWLKWPANDFAASAPGHNSHVPALLYVFWGIHVVHVIAGLFALCWAGAAGCQPCPPSPPFMVIARRTLPWLLLAALFAIPGVYLEWPADAWEHFRRLTEWGTRALTGEHSAGYKSLYFLAYSFVALTPGRMQSTGLGVYFTGGCLLLAWQYYLLARTIGFDRRWAFLSVMVGVVTFGNVCFSFYRYYGLATTLIAQIGAVGLTRLAVEFLRPRCCPPPATPPRTGADRVFPTSRIRLVIAGTSLAILTGFSHVQGLGIAVLSIGSVGMWRLLQSRRISVWWILAGIAAVSVAMITTWPRPSLLDEAYRPGGWLNAWYGFNLLDWRSPAADRAAQILGTIGLVNVGVGIVLLRRNHVVGWLTVGPLAALTLPLAAMPLAHLLANRFDATSIVTFHRMLFSIPSGMALVTLARSLATEQSPFFRATMVRTSGALGLVVCSLVALAPQHPADARLWHLLSQTPQDLQLSSTVSAAKPVGASLRGIGPFRVVAAPVAAVVFNAVLPLDFPSRERLIGRPQVTALIEAIALVQSSRPLMIRPLNRDPLAADRNAWAVIEGSPPDFVSHVGLETISTGLQNPIGKASVVLSSELIPVVADASYHVEFSCRRLSGRDGATYLAVAWYDRHGHLLAANVDAPAGAGNPAGWYNGTYSYLGLAGQAAPAVWTTYRQSFGTGEPAAVPPQAAYVRLGALLNYNATSGAIVQLTNVRLWPKSAAEHISDGVFRADARLFVIGEARCPLVTAGSQAGQVSRHWPAQEVAVGFGGSVELTASAARIAGVKIIAADAQENELRSAFEALRQ